MLALDLFAAAALAAPPAPLHLRHAGAPVEALVIPAGARVVPVAGRPGRTVPAWLAETGGLAAINGGFFNHSDGWPVSHVVAGGEPLTDPERNRALLENPALAPHLATILGRRSAFFAGAAGWAIAPWDAPPAGWRDALQAGPALLPRPALEQEAFVLRDARGRVVRDGIGSAGRAPRAALGLRADGAMVWAVAGKPGLTIAQLAGLMRVLACERALALDGGGSATLATRRRVFVGAGGPAVPVNSALVLAGGPPAAPSRGARPSPAASGSDQLAAFKAAPVGQRLAALGHTPLQTLELPGGQLAVVIHVPEQGTLSRWDDESRIVLYRRGEADFERLQFVSKAGESVPGRMAGLHARDIDGDGVPELVAIGAPHGPVGKVSIMIYRRDRPDGRFERIFRRRHHAPAVKLGPPPKLVYTYETPRAERRFEAFDLLEGAFVPRDGQAQPIVLE